MKFWLVTHYSQTTTSSQPLDPVVHFTQRGQCHLISHRNKSQPWRRKVVFVVPSILQHTAFSKAVHNTALCSLQLAKGGPLLRFDGGGDGHKENIYIVTFYISRWILTGLVKCDTLINFWMNYTHMKGTIVMPWIHLTLLILLLNKVESREKSIQCALWSFEATWMSCGYKMRQIKGR